MLAKGWLNRCVAVIIKDFLGKGVGVSVTFFPLLVLIHLTFSLLLLPGKLAVLADEMVEFIGECFDFLSTVTFPSQSSQSLLNLILLHLHFFEGILPVLCLE